MKRIWSLLLAGALFVSAMAGTDVTAFADTVRETVSGTIACKSESSAADVFGYGVVDGVAYISGYKGTDTTPVIPETIDGLKVAGIGEFAFANNSVITSVTIPESVTEIGMESFAYCTALKEIIIPASVDIIGYAAFEGCDSLGRITVLNKTCRIGTGEFDQYAVSANAVIYGYCDSTAYTYAKSYQRKFVSIGHVPAQTIRKASATAGTDGLITVQCSVCEQLIKTSGIAAPKSIKLKSTAYTYDGKTKKPLVTVAGSDGKAISAANYTVSYPSGRKNPGEYEVAITFKGDYYRGTVYRTFRILPKGTSVAKLIPSKKGFTVKWKKQAKQITGYQIQYSTKKSMKNAKTKTISKAAKTSYKVTKLKAKKKYYVRVRTYKIVNINGKSTKLCSTWSKAKIVTTKK